MHIEVCDDWILIVTALHLAVNQTRVEGLELIKKKQNYVICKEQKYNSEKKALSLTVV